MVAKHTVLLCLVTAAARAAAFAPSARVNTSPYIYGEGVRFRQARHGMQMMAVEPLGGCDREGRRAAIVAAGRATAATVALVGMGPVAPANAKGGDDLVLRLDSDKVQQLPADMGNRVDLEYPAWLEGTWTVTSTMESFKAPLGNRFLGGSNPEINDRSAAEAAAQVGKKIRYQLRFEKQSSGKVREDRLFNQQQRLDAFAGRPVVKKVQYVAIDRGEKTRELNTLVYFAGGLVGKTFSTRRQGASITTSEFVAGENTRQLYARKCDQQTESRVCPPPITTDQETVVQYRLVGDGVVKARVRLLGYLNPQSPQFFDARQQAVTISDYSLELVNSNMAQAPALGETGRGGGGSEGGEGVDEEDEEE